MQVKKKYMSKENWTRITKRRYKEKSIVENGEKAIVSLLIIDELTESLVKNYGNSISVKIVDNGYYWLQVAVENKNYWITAMYDENKDLVQYYIDITLKNVLYEENTPYYYDLFLDIVMLKDGTIILLDEDELKQALKENVIKKEQYEFAYNTANKIMLELLKNKDKLDSFCNKYFGILDEELKI